MLNQQTVTQLQVKQTNVVNVDSKYKSNGYSNDELNWKSHNFERGEIILMNLDGIDSETRGLRPVLVLSNNIANRHSNILTIAPITSQSRSNLPVHVKLDKSDGLKLDSICCLEQTRIASKYRSIIDGKIIRITKLSDKRMEEINRCIRIQFGLS